MARKGLRTVVVRRCEHTPKTGCKALARAADARLGRSRHRRYGLRTKDGSHAAHAAAPHHEPSLAVALLLALLGSLSSLLSAHLSHLSHHRLHVVEEVLGRGVFERPLQLLWRDTIAHDLGIGALTSMARGQLAAERVWMRARRLSGTSKAATVLVGVTVPSSSAAHMAHHGACPQYRTSRRSTSGDSRALADSSCHAPSASRATPRRSESSPWSDTASQHVGVERRHATTHPPQTPPHQRRTPEALSRCS